MSDYPYTGINEAWLHMLREKGGKKVEPVARKMGKNPSTLYKYAHPPELPSLDLLIQARWNFDNLGPLAAVNRACGAAAPIPLPTGDVDVIDRQTVRTIKEFSELMAAGAKAALDGQVSAAEFARIQKEAQQAQEAICLYVEVMRLKVRAGA